MFCRGVYPIKIPFYTVKVQLQIHFVVNIHATTVDLIFY